MFTARLIDKKGFEREIKLGEYLPTIDIVEPREIRCEPCLGDSILVEPPIQDTPKRISFDIDKEFSDYERKKLIYRERI